VKRLAVIGGGSWGTALAVVLAERFEQVRLWVYEQDLAGRMQSSRENDLFLPGATLGPSVEVTSSLAYAVEEAEVVLGVMPSHHARRVYDDLLPHLDENMLFVSATKGIENGTLRLDPCIPGSWPRFDITVRNGKARYDIAVDGTAFYKSSGPDLKAAEFSCLLSRSLALKAVQTNPGFAIGRNQTSALAMRKAENADDS